MIQRRAALTEFAQDCALRLKSSKSSSDGATVRNRRLSADRLFARVARSAVIVSVCRKDEIDGELGPRQPRYAMKPSQVE